MKSKLSLSLLLVAGLGLAGQSVHGQVMATYEFTNGLTAALAPGVVGVTFSSLACAMTIATTDPGVGYPPLGQYYVQTTPTTNVLKMSRNGTAAGWGFANPAAPLSFTVTAGANYEVSIAGFNPVQASGTITLLGRVGYETVPGNNTPGNYTANNVTTFTSPVIVPAGTSLTFYLDLNTGNGTSQHNVERVNVSGSTTLVGNLPDLFAYAQNPATYAVGDTVSNAPSYQYGTPTNFTVLPALPAGLGINPVSGVITGTPNTVVSAADYTVTADFQEGTSDSLNASIAVVDPHLVNYTPGFAIGTVGSPIGNLSPVLLGQTLPTNYTVSPALPAGVALDPSTGIISGTPTETATNTYTVTADYSAVADTTANVTLTITLPSFSYKDNDFVMATNQTIRTATVALSGVAPTNYTVSPALPAGLVLDPVTGEISGTPIATGGSANYTVTANYDGGLPNAQVVLAIQVVDGFADDFNYATGNLSANSLWTHQLGNTGFSLNGAIVSGSPAGAVGLAGPTVTLNASAGYLGGDLVVSVQTAFPAGGGVASGLTFGFQDANNFWSFLLKNGSQASGNLNSDIFIRNTKAGVTQTVLEAAWLTNVVSDQFYTLTARYDADTQNLKFEVRRQNGSLYFSYNYAIDPVNDLPIATNSLCGIQTFSSSASQFENFWGSYGAVSLVPTEFSITSITHEPASGATQITWPSQAGESYSLLKADTADAAFTVLNPAINGNGGNVTSTHTNELGESYYRVKRN